MNRQPGMISTDLLTYVTEKFCIMWALGVVNQGFDFDYLLSICLCLSSDGFLQGHKTAAGSNHGCMLLSHLQRRGRVLCFSLLWSAYDIAYSLTIGLSPVCMLIHVQIIRRKEGALWLIQTKWSLHLKL